MREKRGGRVPSIYSLHPPTHEHKNGRTYRLSSLLLLCLLLLRAPLLPLLLLAHVLDVNLLVVGHCLPHHGLVLVPGEGGREGGGEGGREGGREGCVE